MRPRHRVERSDTRVQHRKESMRRQCCKAHFNRVGIAAACLLIMAAAAGQSWRNRHPQRNRPPQGSAPARNPLPRKSARPARAVLQQLAASKRHQDRHAGAGQSGRLFHCHSAAPLGTPRRERGRRRSQPGIEGSLRQRKERHLPHLPGRQARPLVREHPCEPRRELHVVPPGPHGARPHARQAHPV